MYQYLKLDGTVTVIQFLSTCAMQQYLELDVTITMI